MSMNRGGTTVAVAIALLLATLARADLHTIRSADGKLTLMFDQFQLTNLAGGKQRVVMTGGVDGTSLTQSLHVRCNRAEVLIANVHGRSVFDTVSAKGNVVLVQAGAALKGRTTTITCNEANFLRGPTDTVKGSGAVHIVDAEADKHQVLSATGTACTAELASTGRDPLRFAELEGPVTVHVDQAPDNPDAKPGTLTATGDRLEYQTTGAGATLTLRGHVRVSGHTGASGLVLGGPMNVLILNLNAKGQMIGSSGGSNP